MSDVVCANVERIWIRAHGQDASKYLHSQLSNDIESLTVGQSCVSFVLEPTGKIVALVRVTRVADHQFLIDTDVHPGLTEKLLARLNRFRIRVDVEFDVDARTCVGVRSRDGEPLPTSVRNALGALESVIVLDALWGDGSAVDVVAHDPTPSKAIDAHTVSGQLAGSSVSTQDGIDVETARVRAGWPAMGREIEPGETLAAATGVVARAVSFTKGCYPGQELVERMDSRGSSAPRTLRRFALVDLQSVSGPDLVPGDAVVVDGREVGTVTSVAGEWALAYVQRGVEAGDAVSPAG